MADLPLHMLTDAGFTDAEAREVVERLIEGVDTRSPGEPDRIPVEDLSPQKQEALTRFTQAVATDN